MNQKIAWGAVVGGLLIALGMEIGKISAWQEMLTTGFVSALLLQLGGICGAVWGALNVQLRKDDPAIVRGYAGRR